MTGFRYPKEGEQVKLGGYIGPTKVGDGDGFGDGVEDNYATHLDWFQQGGFRCVETIIERDSIPDLRRNPGMLVYVSNTATIYQLRFDRITWDEFSGSGNSITYTGRAFYNSVRFVVENVGALPTCHLWIHDNWPIVEEIEDPLVYNADDGLSVYNRYTFGQVRVNKISGNNRWLHPDPDQPWDPNMPFVRMDYSQDVARLYCEFGDGVPRTGAIVCVWGTPPVRIPARPPSEVLPDFSIRMGFIDWLVYDKTTDQEYIKYDD